MITGNMPPLRLLHLFRLIADLLAIWYEDYSVSRNVILISPAVDGRVIPAAGKPPADR